MTDSKLIEMLKVLTAEEREEFGLFIASPYFNRGAYATELNSLYAFIMATAPDFQMGQHSKQVAHAGIFAEKPYSEARIDRMMFEIHKLAKDFLLTRHYNRPANEPHQLLDWTTVLRAKGLVNRVAKEFEKIKDLQIGFGNASPETYLTQYRAAFEEHQWQNMFNKVKGDVGLPEVLERLDLFYHANRLELLNRFLLQQKVSTLETPEFIVGALQSSSPAAGFETTSPLLLITWKIHTLLRKERAEIPDFQELMGLLQQHEADIEPETLAQFYAYLRNLCTLLIDAGHTEFDLLLHTLQQDNLARGYFYNAGKISPYACLSIVQQALRAGNIPWAYHFIETHKDDIPGENDTRDFYRMNVALCLFAEKRFQEALEMIPFGSSYSFYHLMARRLELKIYYELHSAVLDSKVDAFKVFVSRVGRKSLSADLSELLTNFGNFVSQLSKSVPGDKKRSEQLGKRIREKKLVGERAWLLEKARELGEKKKF